MRSEYRAVARGVCPRDFGPWLIIAVGVVVATAMFGCSTQPAPQIQYTPPAPSPVHPPGKLEVASWYGPGFVGHLTSDGETFNPDELTAASKTLPMDSRVRVTNPENGRSVVVRINDRGPYVRGRSLDLSRDAAQQIGLTAEGVGRVRVRVLRAKSHEVRADGPTPGRAAPADSAAADAEPLYVRRTSYHQRARRSSSVSRVKNGRTKRAS
jgi:rare lipoprotein A (peptidoglycan hydrolase)